MPSNWSDSTVWRSLRPLPCRTQMTMRALSISRTGDTQTRRVDRNEGRSQLEIGYRIEQILDLLACENRGQMIRPAGHRNLTGDVQPPQCRSVEEPQRTHLHTDGIGRETA